MKKNKVAFVFVVCASFIPMYASAQFGNLGNLLGGGKKTQEQPQNKSGDIDDFLKTADEADGLIRKSSNVLYQAVATKEQLAAHEDAVKAANAIADPKEKEAALKKASDDEQAALAKVDFNAQADKMKTSMDAKQKKQLGSAIYNFTLGMLKDKELLDRREAVMASAKANPMASMNKLPKVKDVLSSIGNQMGNITTIASGIQKLSAVAKLDKLPEKASDPAVAVAD